MNGGVFASFSRRISDALTSIAPVAIFALTVSGVRCSTRPRTATTNSDRSRFASREERVVVARDDLRDPVAVAEVDEDERSQIAHAVHPSEQHDLLPTSARRRAPQVCVRASVPSGSICMNQFPAFQLSACPDSRSASLPLRSSPRAAHRLLLARHQVLDRHLAAGDLVAAEDRGERDRLPRPRISSACPACRAPGRPRRATPVARAARPRAAAPPGRVAASNSVTRMSAAAAARTPGTCRARP